MKIIVYYENTDERGIAERIVPDVAALAKFATDAISPRACPVTAEPDFGWPATSIDVPWVGIPVAVDGGGGGGNGPRAGNNPANPFFIAEHEGHSYYYHSRMSPNYCARHHVSYTTASCPKCMVSMIVDAL